MEGDSKSNPRGMVSALHGYSPSKNGKRKMLNCFIARAKVTRIDSHNTRAQIILKPLRTKLVGWDHATSAPGTQSFQNQEKKGSPKNGRVSTLCDVSMWLES